MIGQSLGGYEIVGEIGSGGMATVYKAYDRATDRHVAIKILPERSADSAIFRERFEREAKSIAKLEHIHILPIFAYGEEGNQTYLVMRYMPTGTLADVLRQGPLPLEEASRLLNQIAGALDAAHKRGIVHRDVKPSNILLDEEGNAYLSDFGIASVKETNQNLTGSGIVGTPLFMSPEQSTSKGKVTGASDQYALGVILYQMVTGGYPFEGDTPLATILQHINDPLPNPRQRRADLPVPAAAVIARALAKNPEERFASCSEMATAFAAALVEYVSEGSEQTLPVTPRTRAAQTRIASDVLPHTEIGAPHRKQSLWIPAVVALVVIAGIAAFVMFRPKDAGSQTGAQPSATHAVSATQSSETGTEPAAATIDTSTPFPTRTPDPVDLAEILDYCLNTICINGPNHTRTKITLPGKFGLSGNLTWSSDGQRILFAACFDADSAGWNCNQVYSIHRDSSDLQTLTGPVGYAPVMSPDGQWIAYMNACTISLMHPDGSGKKALFSGVNCQVDPIWSPDSQRLAWQENLTSQALSGTVWVGNIDGSDRHAIYYDTDVPLGGPSAWSPDGRFVLVTVAEGGVLQLDSACDVQTDPNECKDSQTQLTDFPDSWTATYYPQWAGEALVTSGISP